MPRRGGPAVRFSSIQLHELPGPWLHAMIQDHLSTDERLAVFQVSKDMAAVVLQHAPDIILRLKGTSTTTNNNSTTSITTSTSTLTSSTNTTSTTSNTNTNTNTTNSTPTPTNTTRNTNTTAARGQSSQRRAIEGLLATPLGADLRVRLDGSVAPTWTSGIRQRVKHLVLGNVLLTEDVLQHQLQLQQCPQLQILTVGDVSCDVSEGSWSNLIQQRSHLLTPSLTHLRVYGLTHAAVDGMVRFVGPQVTELTCGNIMHLDPMPKLSQLTDALRQLTHVTLDELTETAMCFLMRLPSVTHVRAHMTKLQMDHTSKQLTWQMLSLGFGAYLQSLMLLPLRSIQHVVLLCGIGCGDSQPTSWEPTYTGHRSSATAKAPLPTAQEAVAHLASCPKLQCALHPPHHSWAPEFAITHQHHSEVVMLCANSMTVAGGLHLDQITLAALQQLLPSIPQLPLCVDALHLTFIPPSRAGYYSAAQHADVLQQLTAALPPHTKELIIDYRADMPELATAIISQLQSSQQSTRLAVAFSALQSIPDDLHVLAAAHPLQVRFLRLSPTGAETVLLREKQEAAAKRRKKKAKKEARRQHAAAHLP